MDCVGAKVKTPTCDDFVVRVITWDILFGAADEFVGFSGFSCKSRLIMTSVWTNHCLTNFLLVIRLEMSRLLDSALLE